MLNLVHICRSWLVLALALGGVFIAWALTLAHIFAKALPCGHENGCNMIASSPASSVGGIPIALIGLVAFVVLAVLAAMHLLTGRENLLRLAFLLSVCATIINLGLTFYAKFGLGLLCSWCLGSNVTFALIALSCSSWPTNSVNPAKHGQALLGIGGMFCVLFAAGGIESYHLLSDPNSLHWNIDAFRHASINELVPIDSLEFCPKNSRLTVVVFVDMQCPACHIFLPELAELAQRKKMRIIVRHLPLSTDKESTRLSVISEIANDDGKGWAYLLRAFRDDLNNERQFVALASEMDCDLSNAQFIRSAETRVDRDKKFAQRLGFRATPTIITIDPVAGRSILTIKQFKHRYY